MSRRAPIITLTPAETQRLHKIQNAHSSAQALALRARVILRCAQPDNPRNDRVARELGCEPDTVCKWRGRFRDGRLDGLRDLPRSGAPRTFSPARPT